MACTPRETTCCGPLIPNQEQTAHCPEGETGDDITIPAGSYFEATQEDANAAALAAAEEALECECPECPECEDCNLITGSLNDAIYESGRDVIFAVMGGRILKCNASTGKRISEARFTVPDIGDSYLTYVSSLDRIFAIKWLYEDTQVGSASAFTLFKIHPDTFAVEASYLVPVSGSTLYGSGPRRILTIGVDVYGVCIITASSGSRPFRFNTGTSVFTSGTVIGYPALWGNIAFDATANGVWVIRASGFAGASFYATGALTFGTTVALTTFNTVPTAVVHRSGYLYFTMAERADTATRYVLKKKSDNTGAITAIDTGRTSALPFNIRYNSTNDRIYVPTWRDDTVVIIDPTADTVESVKTGFDSPFDVVFTPTKAFAVQHSREGLKEII